MFPTVMNLLSIGVFSCKRIAANFLTFVQHNKKNLVEKNSPSWRATKSSFVGRLANFGTFRFVFSSRGNKHVFRAYPSTLKIAKLCFETTAAHSTII